MPQITRPDPGTHRALTYKTSKITNSQPSYRDVTIFNMWMPKS